MGQDFTPIVLVTCDVIDTDMGIASLEGSLAPVPDPEWVRLFGHLRNVVDRYGGTLFTSTEPAALGVDVAWRVEVPDVQAAIAYVHARVALTNEEYAAKLAQQ